MLEIMMIVLMTLIECLFLLLIVKIIRIFLRYSYLFNNFDVKDYREVKVSFDHVFNEHLLTIDVKLV